MATQAEPNYDLGLLDAYCCLVRVLDRGGSIRTQDVVDALHSTAEMRRRDGDAEVTAGLHSILNKLISEARIDNPPLSKSA